MQTLVVYGNCQAEVVATLLGKDPELERAFRVVYLRSFEHPVEGLQELAPGDLSSCAVLLEQHDRRAFPYRDVLPRDASVVKFPALDLNLLWPFNRTNPYNDLETPQHPWGRFPYGDRIVINCIEQGMSAEETLAYYFTRWDEYKPDLDRLFALEDARLLARDVRCDLKMGAYVLESFRAKRLFWTVNHPSGELLSELVMQLLRLAFPDDPKLQGRGIQEIISQNFGYGGPLGVASIPIHPKVAEHLRLTWYDPDQRHQSFDGNSYTYAEYFETMVRSSIANRNASVA